jgi:hypothetical protein
VGTTRFAGYFLTGPDRCRVTVFAALADGKALVQPRRMGLTSRRRRLGPAIACTPNADAIKVDPQQLPIAAMNRDDVGP